jgi:hypothetical protein
MIKMKKIVIIVLLIATALCINGIAQPFGGGQPNGGGQPPQGMMGMGQQGQPPMQQTMMHPPMMMSEPVMKCGNEGVFLLTGQRLTKYNASTLKKIASVELKLDETINKDQHDNRMNQPFMGPGGPSEMLLSGADVLIVSPNSFFRVDAKTMKLVVKTSLNTVRKDNQERSGMGQKGMGSEPGMGMGQPGGMPMEQPFGGPGFGGPSMMRNALELQGGILYFLNRDSLMAINIKDGKTLATTQLENPEPMQPMRQNQPMPMMPPK